MERKIRRQDSIPGYLYALDGLRAVALLMIFFFHSWQQTWISFNIQLRPGVYLFNLDLIQRFGYFAIDAFFVLSGFGLFYPIARSMFKEAEPVDWKTFFIKRLRRIYPAYVLMLLILLIFPVMSWGTTKEMAPLELFKHFGSHLLFIHTFWDKTLGTTISTAWTMGIEVQFYVIFPLIARLFKKKPGWSFAGLLVVSQVLRMITISSENTSMVMQARVWLYLDVFAWGMFAAWLVVWIRNNIQKIERLRGWMTAISAASVVLVWYLMQWQSKITMPQGMDTSVYFRMGLRPLLDGAFALFLVSACYSFRFWEQKIWGNRFFVFLSTISYSFYLWHQNLYIFFKRVNIPYSAQNPVMGDRAAMDGLLLLCAAASLLIAAASTYLVELPIARYGYLGCLKKCKEKIGQWLSVFGKRRG